MNTQHNTNLIGISGKMNSGKDTVGEMIQKQTLIKWDLGKSQDIQLKKFRIKKFAAKLKHIASILTGVPAERFEDQDFKQQVMPKMWWTFDLWHRFPLGQFLEAEKKNPDRIHKITYREFLQRLGTEVMRDRLHSNVWVNALFSEWGCQCEIKEKQGMQVACLDCSGQPYWIVTDVRFPNEARAIQDREGITLRINRPEYSKTGNHASETALDDYEFDYIIENDGTLEDLEKKVQDFLAFYNII